MMQRRLLAIVALVVPGAVVAQPGGDAAVTFRALNATPTGLFVPFFALVDDPQAAYLGATAGRWQLDGRAVNQGYGVTFGRADREGNNFSVTAGAFLPGCHGCDAVPMLGLQHIAVLEVEPRLLRYRRLTINVRTTAGTAREGTANYVAIAIAPGVATSIMRRERNDVTAFVSPGWALGFVREAQQLDVSGAPLLSGGVRVSLPFGRVLQLGVQRAVIDGASTNWSLGYAHTFQ